MSAWLGSSPTFPVEGAPDCFAGADAALGAALGRADAALVVFFGAVVCASARAARRNAETKIAVSLVILNFRFLGDGETASQPEGFRCNFQSGCGLLALVFAALDHADDITHQLDIITTLGGNLLGAAIVFHIIFKDIIEHVIRGERI